MRAVGQADRRRGARNFFHRHAVREVAHPGAAPFLLDGDAEKSELAELRPKLARKFVGAVDLGGVGSDLGLRERADGVAQHLDIAAEIKIEAGKTVRDHRWLCRSAAPAPTYANDSG